MRKQGFTIIEIMVVISIISLLSSIVITTLQDARVAARDAERFQVGRDVEVAIELYRLSDGVYPIEEGDEYVEGDTRFEDFFQNELVDRGFLGRVP